MNAGLVGAFLLLFLTILLGGSALLVYSLVTQGRRRRADRAAPVLQRLATVKARRAEERPTRSALPSRFFATFQLSDSSREEYVLPGGRAASDGLREGDGRRARDAGFAVPGLPPRRGSARRCAGGSAVTTGLAVTQWPRARGSAVIAGVAIAGRGRHTRWVGRSAVVIVAAASLGGCGAGEPPRAVAEATTPARSASLSPATPSPSASTTAPATEPLPESTSSPAADRSAQREAPDPPSLAGNKRNAWAFAPLTRPGRVTIEGSVPLEKAYSTSKVLVVCAFVATVAGGDPRALTSGQRDLIRRALTASDMDALLQLQYAIPGGAQAPITRMLRAIGDRSTVVPSSTFGGMLWSPREQVRFMAALAAGRVVNARTSRYVLSSMHPIPEHSWGLGRIGATAFKGGWLRPDTDTRQMGIVDGHAVAIITYAVGPAVLQTDGDYAHVEQMNKLAGMLQRRLAAERGH